MAQGSKYTDEDIERGLQALAETGGNAAKASRACRIPARTLRDWKTQSFAEEFAELRREKRSGFIDKVWAGAERAMDLLLEAMQPAEDEEEKPKISPRELATVMGILTEKGLLLGGEPTAILKELPQIVFKGVDMSEYEERERE